MEETILIIKNLNKTFKFPIVKKDRLVDYLNSPLNLLRNKSKELVALNNINLEVKRGDFVGILGRNGAGKSTLLKIISQIYLPTSGEIRIKGKVAPFLELGVGFHPDLSGKDNVFFNGTILGMSKEFLKSNYHRIVEFAGLEDFMELPLKNFSSGMQVRLAFSIAMLSEADIFVVDEVLAVGDTAFQQKCFNVFKHFKKDGKTVILVTHNTTLVKSFCNKAYFLSEDGLVNPEGSVNKAINLYDKLSV